MKHRKGSVDRKALQLCSQVRWAVEYSINEHLPAEQAVMVVEVLPAPNTSHLLVIVEPLEHLDLDQIHRIESNLISQISSLRSAIACSIHRRKTPNLSVAVRPRSDQPIIPS